MGGKVNPKAKAYASCDSMSAKGEGVVSSCKKGMDVCLSGDGGTYKIETDSGAFEIPGDQQSCISKVKKITDFGYVVTGGLFSPPKTKAGESEADSEPSASAAEDAPAPEAESAPPVGNVYAGCSKAGAPGSKEHDTCKGIVDICQASPEGPFEIYTDSGPVTPHDQSTCMKVAPALAIMGYELVDPSESPAEDEPEVKPEAAEPAVDEEVPGSDDSDEDGTTAIIKSFADINLRLKVTGDSYATAKRILHFEGGKGIPVKLEYKIEQLSTGRYSMNYTVYKGKAQIGEEESIIFDAEDGKIDLGFKVKLYDPEDFGNVESITIVALD